jgi:hypothetical protein
MISSLDEALDLLQRSKNEGRSFCLALTDKSSAFWFSRGEVVDVKGTKFTFSPATGEPVTATIDLSNSEFVNQKPTEPPDAFQSSMALSDQPILQAKLESGRLLEQFEESGS